MIRALFMKELKQYRTSFLVWSLTIIALMAMTMAAMPTMMASGGIKDLLKAYPPAFMRAFSFDLSTFEDPLGFYTVYSTLYVALLGSVFSISVAAGIIHKEQSLGTAEFLLAKPLSRRQIFLAKLAAYLLLVVALNIVAFFAAWASLAAFAPQPFRLGALAIISTYSFLLALAMGGIGLLTSLLVKRARSLIGPAIRDRARLLPVGHGGQDRPEVRGMGLVEPVQVGRLEGDGAGLRLRVVEAPSVRRPHRRLLPVEPPHLQEKGHPYLKGRPGGFHVFLR